MSLSAEALVLEVRDLAEGDRIIAFLTAEHGIRRGVARGAKRKYSRFAGQLQPLAKVRVSWFEKAGRDLVRLTSVELLRPLLRVQTSLEGLLLATYLADHMLTFAQEGEANEPLFRLLDSCLGALEAGVEMNVAARYYEIWMLRLAGIFPLPRECPQCGRTLGEEQTGAALARAEDAILCRSCAGNAGIAVSPAALALLRRTGRERLEAVAADPPSAAILAEVAGLCARVRRAFLGHELKSYEVARQTLGDVTFASR